MQGIVGNLILPDTLNPQGSSPWLDVRVQPLEEVTDKLAGQAHSLNNS